MRANKYFNNITELYKMHGIKSEKVDFFGVRNDDRLKENLWNDLIGCKDNENNNLYLYRSTVDPSTYYLKKPMNKKGLAHMCLGYHPKIWTIGKHGRSRYTALVNRWWCKKQKVWRDVDKDSKFTNRDIIDYGWFGCNLHRASTKVDLNIIGVYSAGCQVIRNINDFLELRDIAINSKQKKFSYMLFDKKEISFFNDVMKKMME